MTEPSADFRGRPLKVVHLCCTDTGGAGRAAHRLHRALLAEGADSVMLVLNRRGDDPTVRTIPLELHAAGPLPDSFPVNELYARMAMQHWSDLLARYPERRTYIESFSDDYCEVRLEAIPEVRDADVVNLHWVPGIFNPLNAVHALKGKKVVWTMHDLNPFTGGCHYPGDCTRYRESCGSCPLLGSGDPADCTQETLACRRYAYGKLDLHPVSPSRWLAGCAGQSAALSHLSTRVIPNCVPTDLYRPSPGREELRRRHGVPEGMKVILFGAAYVVNERKGFALLVEALKRVVRDDVALAFFGKLPDEARLSLHLPLINLGFVSDEAELAGLYSLADLFIIPSLEDNLPNTVLEAMACGVPVLGFDVGGIPDMVAHRETGYLVPPEDVDGLAAGVEWCLFDPGAAPMSRRCREVALERYRPEVQGKGYLALYREILGSAEVAPPREAGGAGGPEILVPLRPPQISVVTPVLDCAPSLEGCLDSVLSQRHPGLELVVVDCGSADGTAPILQKYRHHLVCRQAGGGIAGAAHEGLAACRGEVLTWLPAESVLHPEALEAVLALLAEERGVEWLMGRPNCVTPDGIEALDFLPLNSRQRYLAGEGVIPEEGVFWRRTLWERAGGRLRKELGHAAWVELWGRFFRHAPLFSVDALLAGSRRGGPLTERELATYRAESAAVLAREREAFAAEPRPYNPPAPLPILLQKRRAGVRP